MKKVISSILSLLLIVTGIAVDGIKVLAKDNVSTSTQSQDTTPILNYENLRITDNNKVEDVTGRLNDIKTLEEGTIIIRFKNYNKTDLMTLFGVSNTNTPNGYFSLYVNSSNGIVGFEVRKQEVGKKEVDLAHVYADASVKSEYVNTLALKAEKNYGYKLFLNGKLVKNVPIKDLPEGSVYGFFKDIVGSNSSYIGKVYRSTNANAWRYNGDIDFVKVYGSLLSDEYLLSKTGETIVEAGLKFPEGVYKSEPVKVFQPGFLGSNNYRIPAILTTNKGTVLASIDARISSGADSPNNIDTAVRRSTDGGKTWDNGKMIINYPDSASTIDTSLVQDSSTSRIFCLVDAFPDGYGAFAAKFGTGYKEIDGKKYMQLFDVANNEYTIRENRIVYDKRGEKTKYRVDSYNNLYENEVKLGNTFTKTCTLKAYGTSYLNLIYSDDDGVTWSEPIIIDASVKKEWMSFLGTGPGRGMQIKNGSKAGRLVFPVYYLNANKKQSSAVIYSDDHGATWKLGESPNDGRNVGDRIVDSKTVSERSHELTESQVVEMPDGQLKLFMRSYGGYVKIATSFDGGETWEPVVEEDKNLLDPYCQMSVINYSNKIEGSNAVIFSNPSALSRANGTVRIGLINENGTYENGKTKYVFNWKYSKVIKPDKYAYSCLTELTNGNIGLFYEGTDNTDMSYTEMNLEYLKWKPEVKVPKRASIDFMGSKATFREGDKVSVKFTFDERVIAMGQRTINAKIGDYSVPLSMIQSDNGKELIFEGPLNLIPAGKYPITVSLTNDTEIYNVSGKQYRYDGGEKYQGTINIDSSIVAISNKDENTSLTTDKNEVVIRLEDIKDGKGSVKLDMDKKLTIELPFKVVDSSLIKNNRRLKTSTNDITNNTSKSKKDEVNIVKTGSLLGTTSLGILGLVLVAFGFLNLKRRKRRQS